MNKKIEEIYNKALEEHRSNNTAWEELNPKKFAELIIRECINLSKEACNELKADESIQTPGFKTSMNLYHATLRNKISEIFQIDGV